LLVPRPEDLSELQQTSVCCLYQADPAIAEASQVTKGFLHLVRERAGDDLDGWIARATASSVAELRRYACGLLTVRAPI
jgi:hypothetical protein